MHADRSVSASSERWTAFQIAVLAIVLWSSSCIHKPPVIVRNGSVQEVPNLGLTAEDPAVKGDIQFVAPPAGTPSEGQEPGGVFSRMQPSPGEVFTLMPGESHALTIAVQQASTVFANATWSGGAGPVSIVVSQTGVVVTSGTTVLAPPNRGSALAVGDVKTPMEAHLLSKSGLPSIRFQEVTDELETRFCKTFGRIVICLSLLECGYGRDDY